MFSSLLRRRTLTVAAVLAVGAIALWAFRTGGSEVDFNEDIRPILNENCVTCHGGVRQQAELSLLFRDDALQPTESGKHAIVPGRSGKSELIRRVTHTDPDERMPAEGPALSNKEIDLLKRWIDEGAAWEPHWAYVAPTTPDVPGVSDPAWPNNDIDRFVLARLDRENLRPSPEADCTVLLRRVSLDLTGLPPSPEDTDAFCADPSDMQYEEAVNKLLASPRFGERWAGYWLDLARYADSNGYEKDTPRSIWKYRNWVIEAFNEDMPFDRFSTQQLAGDLLPDADTKQLIATAFHRNTMTNTEGGTDDEEFRVAAVMDRLNTTFEVWQGTTIGCVQCHGHPYDPFRGEEFYELLAFFNNTADVDRDDNEPKLYEFDERPEEGRRLIAELEKLEQEMHEAVNPDDFAAWTQRFEEYARDIDRPPFFEGRTLNPPVIRTAQKEADRRSPNDIFILRSLFIDMDPAFEAMRAERSRLQKVVAELGPLSDKMLGPSVFPPQPPGLWTNPYSDLTWVTSEGEDRYRRALYTYWRRTVPYPSLLAFDAMSRELCTSRRIRTNSPLQSLVTLNDPVYVEAAVALARRMQDEGYDTPEDRLRQGYRLALQRDPPEEALQHLVTLYETALADYRQRPEAAAALVHIKENAFAGYEEAEQTDYGSEPAYVVPNPASPSATGSASPEEGALAVAANAILNLDAFLTKE